MKIIVLFCILQGCLGAALVDKRAPCSNFCVEIYKPVCGTDGKTYSNDCKLGVATCHDNTIQLAHPGTCGSAVGRSASICPAMACIAVYDPVCGTDGKTYSNTCSLTTTNCHGEVKVAYHGACAGDLLVS